MEQYLMWLNKLLLAVSYWLLANSVKKYITYYKRLKFKALRNFRNLEIWKDGIAIVKLIYKLVDTLPDNERYGLRSQMCRAAVSIPCNISEGSSRSSETDFKRFLEMSMGSAFELETQLIVLTEIGMCTVEQIKIPFQKLDITQGKINALINKLKDSIDGH